MRIPNPNGTKVTVTQDDSYDGNLPTPPYSGTIVDYDPESDAYFVRADDDGKVYLEPAEWVA